tara:strand:+ start:319 stop:645 length:327 start_codon:yes stop_codon:yes gene_type:complete
MELKGTIRQIEQTQTFGTKGYKVRKLLLETIENYPQKIQIDFSQDKCEVLDNYKIGDVVKIAINIRGREWQNKDGVTKYINTIAGWKIEHHKELELADQNTERDDLPF